MNGPSHPRLTFNPAKAAGRNWREICFPLPSPYLPLLFLVPRRSCQSGHNPTWWLGLSPLAISWVEGTGPSQDAGYAILPSFWRILFFCGARCQVQIGYYFTEPIKEVNVPWEKFWCYFEGGLPGNPGLCASWWQTAWSFQYGVHSPFLIKAHTGTSTSGRDDEGSELKIGICSKRESDSVYW